MGYARADGEGSRPPTADARPPQSSNTTRTPRCAPRKAQREAGDTGSKGERAQGGEVRRGRDETPRTSSYLSKNHLPEGQTRAPGWGCCKSATDRPTAEPLVLGVCFARASKRGGLPSKGNQGPEGTRSGKRQVFLARPQRLTVCREVLQVGLPYTGGPHCKLTDPENEQKWEGGAPRFATAAGGALQAAYHSIAIIK